MRYDPLPPEFHAANRARLAEAIGPEAIAIIDTADVLTRAGDYEYPFRPDSNFYYLTGIDEPKAILLLVPGHPTEKLREILFIQETNDFMALWEGQRLTQDEARKRSGIQTVLWLAELDFILGRAVRQYRRIYLNNEATIEPGSLDPSARRAEVLRRQLPTHDLRSAVNHLGDQRAVKAEAEVDQIRQAVELTGRGLAKAWNELRPNIPEYTLEAELVAEFTRGGSTGVAFAPVIGTGKNSTIIHHRTGSTRVAAGDLVLFDVGAEVGYYAADVSRTIPVDGHFTARQRSVYEAVYRTQATGLKLHKPGTSVLEIDEAMRKLLLEELVKLGEVSAKDATGPDAEQHLRKYYAHISHHLGLGVHDTGGARLQLKPGMVVTCEPGLYLPKESIGVRLEDVVLITETGHEVLSAGIPSDPDEIEKIIQEHQA